MKSIEIGYTIPKNLLSKVGIEHLRVYANAYNPNKGYADFYVMTDLIHEPEMDLA
uniref:hypothetical protein n=1 Tax=Parabacteroides distasonis TaxID=823 RepID=UPI00402977B2